MANVGDNSTGRYSNMIYLMAHPPSLTPSLPPSLPPSLLSLQLLLMADEAVDITDKPVLVIMRKFCERLIAPRSLVDGTASESFELHKSRGVHFFFTNNW